jgi:hypothetical protein
MIQPDQHGQVAVHGNTLQAVLLAKLCAVMAIVLINAVEQMEKCIHTYTRHVMPCPASIPKYTDISTYK